MLNEQGGDLVPTAAQIAKIKTLAEDARGHPATRKTAGAEAVSVTSRSAMRAHARAAVASSCRVCRDPINARRSTRRFCSGRCRIAHWRGALPAAHQRRIREREAERDPRPVMATLDGCTVAEIAYAEAKTFVTRYEYLRTMPPVTRTCYGLRTPEGDLAGVVVFAVGHSPESGDLCGREHRNKAICLARCACAHGRILMPQAS